MAAVGGGLGGAAVASSFHIDQRERHDPRKETLCSFHRGPRLLDSVNACNGTDPRNGTFRSQSRSRMMTPQ